MIVLALILTILRALALLAAPLFLLLWSWYDFMEEARTPFAGYAFAAAAVYVLSSYLFMALPRDREKDNA